MTIAGPTEPSIQLYASVATFRVLEAVSLGQSPVRCQRKGVTPICEGPFVISRTEGKELAYIHIGPFSRPLFPRSRVWRASRSEIILPQPTPGRYWLIGVDGTPHALERLKDTLTCLCDYSELPGVDTMMDELPSLTFSDTSDQEHEKDDCEELATVNPTTPGSINAKSDIDLSILSRLEKDLAEALIPSPEASRIEEDITVEVFHEALEPTPVTSPIMSGSCSVPNYISTAHDLQLLEPLTFLPSYKTWDKPRFTHPLIPKLHQRAPFQRNTYVIGPQALYNDITTVSGFVAWRAMNRMVKRH